jgi:hypothetical protein
MNDREAPQLLPLAHEMLAEADFEVLLDATVDAQAHGPFADDARAVWRVLFVEGCPLDHIWRVFFHAWKDPDSDPQDWVTVTPAVALAEARRYVALRFPRASGPWPGLGCRNTFDCVRARIDAFAQHESLVTFHGVDEIIKLRAVMSPRLAARVDDAAKVDDLLRVGWLASNRIDKASELFAWVDAQPRAEVFGVARRWVCMLDEELRAGHALHDVDGDRFVAIGEALERVPLCRRPEPSRPTERRGALRALIAPWDAAYRPPWRTEGNLDRLLDHRDWEDPLEWLESVVEIAIVEWDEETALSCLRSPR